MELLAPAVGTSGRSSCAESQTVTTRSHGSVEVGVHVLGLATRDVDADLGHGAHRERVDARGRGGARRARLPLPAQQVVDPALGHLRAAGVAGAQDEDALRVAGHGRSSGTGGSGSFDPVDRPCRRYYISLDNEMAKPLSATVHALKALAHPGRLRILAMLRGGELCVCQMTAVLDLAASSVSAHLADLKRAGPRRRAEGRPLGVPPARGRRGCARPCSSRSGRRSPGTRRSRPTRACCVSCGAWASRSSAGWTWT